MKKLTLIIFFLFCSHLNATKVYDAFLFFNEIDLLKIRLTELEDVVDYFVLVESKHTFSGKEKPSYYLKNRDQFKNYNKKIIHILLDNPPDSDYWQNEYFQRNAIVQGLKNADDNDIVICSDIDEIPRKDTVTKIKELYENKQASLNDVFYLNLDYFVFKLNNFVEQPWMASYITNIANVKSMPPQIIRQRTKKLHHYFVSNAGWHFSWMGSPEEALYKLKSFSHAKDSFVKDDQTMLNYFQKHNDLGFAGTPYRITTLEINSKFPIYIQKHQDYFTSIGWIKPISKETISLQPEQLLTPERFSVISKYIYAKYHDKKIQTNYHLDLYHEILRILSPSFKEGACLENRLF
ncbi:MAG: hypothetical protein P0S95_06140 [Rhabdochlamydiaceae bacterium]|nr:hypothetical protein [Candidatus Amphrikana amoebophyrae]